jgi:hypothetical protein
LSPCRPAVEHLECRTVPSVTYDGGPVLPNVGVEAVFYGKAWSTDSALQTEEKQIADYFRYHTGSSYMDLLAQYSTSSQTIGHGSYLDSVVLPATPGTSINDCQLRTALANAISSGTVHTPDANHLYFVFVEPGVVVTLQGQDSVINFLGYHNAFAGPTGQPG